MGDAQYSAYPNFLTFRSVQRWCSPGSESVPSTGGGKMETGRSLVGTQPGHKLDLHKERFAFAVSISYRSI